MASRKIAGYWKDTANVQKFLNEFACKYNVNTVADWKLISARQIKSNGGSGLLNNYSLSQIKTIGCPEGALLFKNRQVKPSNFWKNDLNVKYFICELKNKFNLQSFDDWKLLSQKQVKSIKGGNSLLNNYSMYDIKCIGFPEGKLLFSESKSSEFWKDKNNLNNFLDTLKDKFKLKSLDDWKSLTNNQVKMVPGGNSILHIYSMYDLKCMGFPDGKNIFKKQMKYQYWNDMDNVQHFLAKLKQKYNLTSPYEWNLLTVDKIRLNGGSSLLKKYSLYEIKNLGCPEGKFQNVNRKNMKGIWSDENINDFLQNLKDLYNLNSPEDWNSITKKHIMDSGGSGIFKRYSLFDLKCLACPDSDLVLNSKAKSSGFWKKEENIDDFLNMISTTLNLKTFEDWKRISRSQIIALGGRGLLSNFTMEDLINRQFPDNLEVVNSNKRSSQRWLFLQVQQIFPGEEIVEDYYHSEISRETGYPVQFDVYLVKKRIAFEYHGKQHYEEVSSAFTSPEMYQFRDSEKVNLCKKFDITLIIIPYWWNNKIGSLVNKISGIIKTQDVL